MNTRRTRLWVGLAAALLALLIAGASAWGYSRLRQNSLLALQHCADNAALPGSGWVCRQVMRTTQPKPDEIAYMNSRAGAQWVFIADHDDDARALLRRYLAAGLDLHAVDEQQQRWTALHSAALDGEEREVRILLEFGADAARRDTEGRTPADLARLAAQKQPDEQARFLKVAQTLDEAVRQR